MRKKAQIAGQVFIYVAAAILFVLIMLYGYKAIQGFLGTAQSVQMAELKADLIKSIDAIAPTANVEHLTLTLPSGFEEICFVDLKVGASSSDLCDSSHDEYRPLVCNSWEGGARQNVFVLPKGDIEIVVSDVRFEEGGGSDRLGYLCVQERFGKIDLLIKGEGDHTYLDVWEVEDEDDDSTT